MPTDSNPAPLKPDHGHASAHDMMQPVLMSLKRLAFDEMAKYEHSRVFTFPFMVTEKCLTELEDEVLKQLNIVPTDTNYRFSAVTRFQDMTSVRHDSFKVFLEKAGNKKDPEAVLLSWSKFALAEDGMPIAGQIDIVYMTEKRLESVDSEPGEQHRAKISLTVTGSDDQWVESAYNNVAPYVEVTKLSGIYKPLWIFRNKWFLLMLTYILPFAGFLAGVNLAAPIAHKDSVNSAGNILQKIAAEPAINIKIDLLARQLLAPSREPWWSGVSVFLFGGICYLMVYLFSVITFPRLTPRSSIAIGLSGSKAAEYLNAFKFVVFSLLLLGVLVPLLLGPLQSLLGFIFSSN